MIASIEERQTETLKAEAYRNTVLPAAEAAAFGIEKSAFSRAESAKIIAEAESERFSEQLKAFRSMPQMFMLNARMEALETDGASIQKYVVPADIKDMVYQMNFEKNERLDLVNLDVSELSDKN